MQTKDTNDVKFTELTTKQFFELLDKHEESKNAERMAIELQKTEKIKKECKLAPAKQGEFIKKLYLVTLPILFYLLCWYMFSNNYYLV